MLKKLTQVAVLLIICSSCMVVSGQQKYEPSKGADNQSLFRFLRIKPIDYGQCITAEQQIAQQEMLHDVFLWCFIFFAVIAGTEFVYIWHLHNKEDDQFTIFDRVLEMLWNRDVLNLGIIVRLHRQARILQAHSQSSQSFPPDSPATSGNRQHTVEPSPDSGIHGTSLSVTTKEPDLRQQYEFEINQLREEVRGRDAIIESLKQEHEKQLNELVASGSDGVNKLAMQRLNNCRKQVVNLQSIIRSYKDRYEHTTEHSE